MASTQIPTAMRALLHDLKRQTLSVGSIPTPSPSSTQYLVKSHAVGLTVGELSWPRPDQFIVSSPGVEFVATVVTSPSASSTFQPGDEVYARVTYPHSGAARAYTLTSDDEIALRPKNISITEAATIPVSALTAWQVLFGQFELDPPTPSSTKSSAKDIRILITAASGSVGIWATQLAKLAGLHVIATAGTRNLDFVKSLGADEVLDYSQTNIQAWIEEDPERRKVDLVFDCIGRSALEQAWHAVKEGGKILTIVPPADMQWKWVLDRPKGVSETISGEFFVMHPSGEQLGLITALVEANKVKPLVDSVWKFDEYQQAFDRLASGKTTGKVVLRVDDE
ncbi:hypothetical protein B0A52_00198 [Exophiala mesophila]|uniref:Enoyl reductase (ER) domain-containing protein n=1 Tax=Exophiala mesophila TaxID=212818 RepID=A0A438NJD5_EXOME|nr:hypothetical protein B0A52_00198 [Exophiala mesophila]